MVITQDVFLICHLFPCPAPGQNLRHCVQGMREVGTGESFSLLYAIGFFSPRPEEVRPSFPWCLWGSVGGCCILHGEQASDGNHTCSCWWGRNIEEEGNIWSVCQKCYRIWRVLHEVCTWACYPVGPRGWNLGDRDKFWLIQEKRKAP